MTDRRIKISDVYKEKGTTL